MVPAEAWPGSGCDNPLVRRRPPHQTRCPSRAGMCLMSLWTLSPQARQAHMGWTLGKHLEGWQGILGDLSPVSSALAHPGAVQPHAGELSWYALHFLERGGRDQLGACQTISLPPRQARSQHCAKLCPTQCENPPLLAWPPALTRSVSSSCPLPAGWMETVQWEAPGPGKSKRRYHQVPPSFPEGRKTSSLASGRAPSASCCRSVK